MSISINPAYSSQSNNFSTLQRSNALAEKNIPSNDLLSPETKNKLNDYSQDKINEATEAVASKKQTLWQVALGQVYVESQKTAINAYTMASTGEKLYETSNSSTSLTDVYALKRNEYLSEKYAQIVPDKKPTNPENPVTILPIEVLQTNEVATYQSVQKPTDNSILHLVA